MKSIGPQPAIALLALGLVLAAAPARASALLDLEVKGSGTVETNCLVTLTPGCTITASGEATGTPINLGAFILRLDTGSPSSLNGSPVSTPQGVCLPASFVGRLTADTGDTISFTHTGTVCEEAGPGSAYHYTGTFRITGGTGAFGAAVGAGSAATTFTREGASVFLHLRGTVAY